MLKNIKKKNEKGFSFVELMAVMAIISIMAGSVFVISSRSGATQDVEAASQQITSQLRNLQNESLSGKRIEYPVGSDKYESPCRFFFTSTVSAYSIKYDKNCSGISSLIGTSNFDIANKRVSLEPKTIIFSSPWGKIDSINQITVTSNKVSTVKRYIYLNSMGNIEISETPVI